MIDQFWSFANKNRNQLSSIPATEERNRKGSAMPVASGTLLCHVRPGNDRHTTTRNDARLLLAKSVKASCQFL